MSSGNPAKILVVDDDEMILTVVGKILHAAGFSTEVSLSASDALDLLCQSSYDAILCDMWMPAMTGSELYLKLEKEFPQYQSRMVFMTGDLVSEVTWNFIEERNLPYVLKPIVPEDLIRKLTQLLGVKAMAPAPSVEATAPVSQEEKQEQRRGRRVFMKASAWIRKTEVQEDPEVIHIANASTAGLYFFTGRAYGVGMEVEVVFPYTGLVDIKQKGYVVRVEEREDGHRGVAIALGAAAAAVRAALKASEERAKGAARLSPAPSRESRVEAVIRAADLRFQVSQARQQASFLALELADLKAMRQRAAGKGQSALLEKSPEGELEELMATKAALNQVIRELQREIEALRMEVASAPVGPEQNKKSAV